MIVDGFGEPLKLRGRREWIRYRESRLWHLPARECGLIYKQIVQVKLFQKKPKTHCQACKRG